MRSRIVGPNRIVITAHAGSECPHEVEVVGRRRYGVDSPDRRELAVTVRWNASQGEQGLAATREFADALLTACHFGEGMLRQAEESDDAC